jgi:hypothetical protein
MAGLLEPIHQGRRAGAPDAESVAELDRTQRLLGGRKVFQGGDVGDSDTEPAGEFLVGLHARLLHHSQGARGFAALSPTATGTGCAAVRGSRSGGLRFVVHGVMLAN